MFNRLKARLRLIFNHGEELNRRVTVENELFMIAAGKKPIPSRDECRKMALRLGTPRKQWTEGMK